MMFSSSANPILEFVRWYYNSRMVKLSSVAESVLGNWEYLLVVEDATEAQCDHARKVLSRLARLGL